MKTLKYIPHMTYNFRYQHENMSNELLKEYLSKYVGDKYVCGLIRTGHGPDHHMLVVYKLMEKSVLRYPATHRYFNRTTGKHYHKVILIDGSERIMTYDSIPITPRIKDKSMLPTLPKFFCKGMEIIDTIGFIDDVRIDMHNYVIDDFLPVTVLGNLDYILTEYDRETLMQNLITKLNL